MEKLTGEITILDIFRKVNIPTLIILPQVCHMIHRPRIKRRSEPPVPLYMLMWEYGLVTSYIDLQNNMNYLPEGLVIKFTEEVLTNKKLTTDKYTSLNDRLCDNPVIDNVWRKNGHVFYKVEFPRFMIKNVEKIMNSEYSKIDMAFKDNLRLFYTSVPYWPENYGHFIMKYNIPRAIVLRHPSLKNMIEDALDVKIPDHLEYVRKFNMEEDIYYYD